MNCRTTIRISSPSNPGACRNRGRTGCPKYGPGSELHAAQQCDGLEQGSCGWLTQTSLADRAGAPIERPLPLPSGNALFGSDVVAETLRALEVPFIALNPGASYRGSARQPGELPGQRAAADAAVPARGARRRHRSRLRQGDRPADGRRGALQCRADACDDGRVQRLVRPHAGAVARRDRPGGCAEAAAVDRLDPYRARPGRADPPLHQVGRSARLGRGGARVAAARLLAGQFGTQGAGLHQSRRRHAGGADRRSAAADRCSAVCARRGVGGGAGAGGARGGDAARGEAAGDPDGARLARRAGMGRPRGAGGDAARPRDDRSQMRRGIPHRPSAACRRTGDVPGAGGGAGHRRRRCHPEPRLGGSGGRAEGGVRHGLADRQGDRGHAGSSASQRLEHGPSGVAAGRSVHRRRRRYRGRGAAGATAARRKPRGPNRAQPPPKRRPRQARSAWRR